MFIWHASGTLELVIIKTFVGKKKICIFICKFFGGWGVEDFGLIVNVVNLDFQMISVLKKKKKMMIF